MWLAKKLGGKEEDPYLKGAKEMLNILSTCSSKAEIYEEISKVSKTNFFIPRLLSLRV